MGSTVRANITVEVSFPADSVWSEDTTIAQVTKQALDSFYRKVQNINTPSVQRDIKRSSYEMTVVGKPRVDFVVIKPDAPKE